MKCPNCTTTLESINARKLEIKKCPNCNGFWFPGGELEKFIEEKFPDKQEKLDVKNSFEADKALKIDDKCSDCVDEKLIFGTVGEITIYMCKICNGCFLSKIGMKQLLIWAGVQKDPRLAEELIGSLAGGVICTCQGHR